MASDWQPIETAPKDRSVLTCIAKGGHPYIPINAFLWDGKWFGSDNKPLAWKPTHWMPVPAAPSHTGGAE